MNNDIVLEARNISKTFNHAMPVQVLSDISFSINKGEFVSIVGKSGCGKSTLLYILSTMDTDYDGELWIDRENMFHKKERQLAAIRNEKIGFVFQFHYLINEFDVLRNIMLPALKLNQFDEKEIERRATQRLAMLGIDQLSGKKPNQLSGGEKQRVAIARALINDPQIIMADEPTGNLDKSNSELVFDIFLRLSNEMNHTMLMVTHDATFAARSHRRIEMEDGRVIRQS